MSNEAQAWAATIKTGSVTGKAILLRLANFADEDGSCFPSQERLARELECSVRAVRKWLAIFEKSGLLKREERRRKNGYRTSDRIYLNMGTSPESGAGENPDLTGTQEQSHRHTGTVSPESGAGYIKDESSGELKEEYNPTPPQAEAKTIFQLRKELKGVFDEFGMSRTTEHPTMLQFRQMWNFGCQRKGEAALDAFVAFGLMDDAKCQAALDAMPFYQISQRRLADDTYRLSLAKWIAKRAWEGMEIPEADLQALEMQKSHTEIIAANDPELFDICLARRFAGNPHGMEVFGKLGRVSFANNLISEVKQELGLQATGTGPP